MVKSQLSSHPELVFALVAPIGVDMPTVQDALGSALLQVGYKHVPIHLTQKAFSIFGMTGATDAPKTFDEKISIINEPGVKSGRQDFLALLAILEVYKHGRDTHGADVTGSKEYPKYPRVPVERAAFVIRQFKREEEISTLRKVYGRNLVQVSITISERQQLSSVSHIVARDAPALSQEQILEKARALISRDRHEEDEDFGQRLSDTFHTADVFVDGNSDATIRRDCHRFVRALFGDNFVTPTIDEYGSYLARAASLRSADLSRQVGAAILSAEGDVISLGCNEVPKAGGGNYWCTDVAPKRDIDRKFEANKLETNKIIHNLLDALGKAGFLAKDKDSLLSEPEFRRLMKRASISDLTEYGRMTHAEMSALLEAARNGRAVKGATIFVTTFPCHNCAKHLISAGIARIVYIEPYPKSRAMILHDDSLSRDESVNGRVSLEHFHGISPRRYRDIFEKSRRKNADGDVFTWYSGEPSPMLLTGFSTHILFEPEFVKKFEESVKEITRT